MQRDQEPRPEGAVRVFAGTEMDSGASPHLVVCVGCAEGIVEAGEGELLTTPQGDVIDSTRDRTAADEDIPEL
jgi:hypothetical protein